MRLLIATSAKIQEIPENQSFYLLIESATCLACPERAEGRHAAL